MSGRRPQVMRAAEHRRLWRMVSGAVRGTFNAHPDYLTGYGRDHATNSITKRVVGQLVGHAKEARTGTRAGGSRGDGGVLPARRAGRIESAPRSRFSGLAALLVGEGEG